MESSRRRLLTVADAERDRLEADLHGRVQARLERVAALVRQTAHDGDLPGRVADTHEAVSSFARGVPTAHAVYWMCERAATDPSFDKCPRLAVLACPGYEPEGA